MIRTEALRFRKGDLVAVAVVIALSLSILGCFLFGNKAPSSQAEIYLHGELIKTVDLTVDQTFVVENRYRNTVTVTDGAVAITDSDCPGKDCVYSGSIRTAGRVLVCLPNGVEIRAVSTETDVDFVVR